MDNNKEIKFQFINDIDMVILALENGDIEDALGLLKEIKEEQQGLINSINLN
tara:strand:- start:201 stop:356 length:156 start_codon:yes stop_codon:yes gene_type:complete